MKVRRYEAKTYRDALAQVRDDLGPDAVILTTKELTRGGLFGLFAHGAVEIVAATDVPVASVATRPAGRTRAEGPSRYDRSARRPEPRLREPAVATVEPLGLATSARTATVARSVAAAPSAVAVAPPPAAIAHPSAEASSATAEKLGRLERGLGEIRDTLQAFLMERVAPPVLPSPLGAPAVRAQLEPWLIRLRASGVPEEVAQAILGELPDDVLRGDDHAQPLGEAVRQVVRQQFQVAGPLLGSGRQTTGRVVALVGPTGVGKTTTLAKLAAQYGLVENRRVALLTVDTYRVAAVEQLRTFADIMALPIEVASTASEARAKLWSLGGQDLVLIDTAGRSQHATERIDELCELMRSLEPDEIHLVVSATTKPDDLVSICEEFKRLEPNRLIATKLDETRTYGGLLALARATRLPISYVTHGQKVPEDMAVADVSRLVELILNGDAKGAAP